MKGITFGDLHSYRDLHLLLTGKEIGSPETKRLKIDVPGADGGIDYTEFFGEPKYEDVTHKFTFAAIAPTTAFPALFSTVKNALHGRKMRIILDDEPQFYYVGRLEVSPFTNDRNIGTIKIDAECEPFKYKLNKTTITRAVDGTESIVLTNSRKRAVPEVTITAEGSMRIVYGENIWDLGGGSYTLPELELLEGANAVTVTGTGTVSFAWQEASL